MDARVENKLSHFVGGCRIEGQSERYGDVYNPATGEIIRRVPLASKEEVQSIIENAARAFPDWSQTPPARRVQVLYRFRELLLKQLDEVAEILSLEHGKTLDDAKGSITRGLEVVEFACGIPQLLKGEYSEGVAAGVDSWSTRQPLGFAQGLHRLIFLPWCRCGCFRLQLLVAIRSC